jgi:hypothetical protein
MRFTLEPPRNVLLRSCKILKTSSIRDLDTTRVNSLALLRLHAPDSLKELLMSDPSVLQYIDYIRKISDAITEREEGLLDADVKASAGATVSKTRL